MILYTEKREEVGNTVTNKFFDDYVIFIKILMIYVPMK